MSLRREPKLIRRALSLASLAVLPAQLVGQDPTPAPPGITYRVVDGRALQAYVVQPRTRPTTGVNGILLFHGGGWVSGSPDWTFDAARRFADAGLVAIAVEYRLSTGSTTPIEALDDVCASFAWARSHADSLGMSDRLAGYGVSAGGHLVAATATVGCGPDPSGQRTEADALLLLSPALDVPRDGWFRQLLRGRAPARDYSPVDHVHASTPPTSVVHGEKDTLTPIAGVRVFCDRLRTLGGTCEINAYPGLGHLLTRNLTNQESDFDPDPEARADGLERLVTFLRTIGFLPPR